MGTFFEDGFVSSIHYQKKFLLIDAFCDVEFLQMYLYSVYDHRKLYKWLNVILIDRDSWMKYSVDSFRS